MEEFDEPNVASVGERLRAAREEKGLTLEEVADQTRIPRRHLESLELSDWPKLPAPTYTMGFAKSYASAVGLDRTEIGDQLRGEMGGHRPDSTSSEVFEPADPARTMPKGLVFGALAAIVLIVLVLTWLNNRSLQPDAEEAVVDDAPTATAAEPQSVQPSSTPAQPTNPQGAVVLTASEPVWIRVADGGQTLFQGELAAGQTYNVPTSAAAPTLTAGKPEALRVTVGTATAPPVGPAGRVASNVSLAPTDLMRGGNAPAPATGVPAPTQ